MDFVLTHTVYITNTVTYVFQT